MVTSDGSITVKTECGTLYTLIESAKMVGVSPKAYIQSAVAMALTQTGIVLLPDGFKRQIDAVSATQLADT